MSAVYGGVNRIARLISESYCQVCGVTRHGIAAYAGVDSVARKIFDLSYSNNTSPGIYDKNSKLLATYEESGIDVTVSFGDSNYSSDIRSGTQTMRRYPKATKIVIPDTVNISMIGDNAFNGCSSLTEICIPSTVNYIGRNAFKDCIALKSIVLPESVSSIGESILRGCKSLNTVDISKGITYIPPNAFSGCTSLQSAVLKENLQMIDSEAFRDCTSLVNIDIPNNLIYISPTAFTNVRQVTYHKYLWGAPWGALLANQTN